MQVDSSALTLIGELVGATPTVVARNVLNRAWSSSVVISGFPSTIPFGRVNLLAPEFETGPGVIPARTFSSPLFRLYLAGEKLAPKQAQV